MSTQTTTCYRHPSRETGVACSNCGRFICPDCMTPTPVGMRCPECSKQKTQVRTISDISRSGAVQATTAIIALNVIVFLASGQFNIGSGGTSGSLALRGELYGPSIAEGHQYYRLVTSGFLHAGLLHIGFNMYILWWLGNLLEPAIGKRRFVGLYFVSMLTGSIGALLVTPDSPTVGASGAIFGLMGVAFMEMRARGIDPMASGIGPTILLNLVLSFTLSGISIGGHIGGLVGGGLATLVLHELDKRRTKELAVYAVLAVMALAAAGGGIAVAKSNCGAGSFCKERAAFLDQLIKR
ncbi:rhomboid family intramembrane serine protease [Paraconexibacter antarcticus]|uniref:Rhomboid family intramembrane serine protease n=1 Tax=Paraconexibacter antarcticus TaxID=2949664 RepID=A0ABY5E063_9ACTN|nr:rhomboid family intramembrane serine protease [Paraconexibacter antarcticus]UTI66542.1 rhomboid family intramembrane serine protease [Paraconexibacter antarcticus]